MGYGNCLKAKYLKKKDNSRPFIQNIIQSVLVIVLKIFMKRTYPLLDFLHLHVKQVLDDGMLEF
jgi:hypothetical protein